MEKEAIELDRIVCDVIGTFLYSPSLEWQYAMQCIKD